MNTKNILLTFLVLIVLSVAIILILNIGKKTPAEQAIENIRGLEQKIYTDTLFSIDQNIANKYILACSEFADKFPEDTLAPGFLFRAGEIAKGLNQISKALRLFSKISTHYPEYEKAPLAIFFQAMIYDDHLKNIEKAREYYTLFIKKYPDHEFADDAQACINNLGKTLEEIIEEFEKNQKVEKDSLEGEPV